MVRMAIRIFALAVVCGAMLAFGAGCVGMVTNPNSELPANSPASWEGKSLGVPL